MPDQVLHGGFRAANTSGLSGGKAIGTVKKGGKYTLGINGKNVNLPEPPGDGTLYRMPQKGGGFGVNLVTGVGGASPQTYKLQQNTLFGFETGWSWDK